MGILETKKIVLLNYPLSLSLLKYRNVWVFWNKKKSGSYRCSPLNSSIDMVETNLKPLFGPKRMDPSTRDTWLIEGMLIVFDER